MCLLSTLLPFYLEQPQEFQEGRVRPRASDDINIVQMHFQMLRMLCNDLEKHHHLNLSGWILRQGSAHRIAADAYEAIGQFSTVQQWVHCKQNQSSFQGKGDKKIRQWQGQLQKGTP